MSILYYDCFCGISGDMNLGALIDLGVDPEYLKSELAKLPMADEFELEIFRAQKKGIEGTKVNVLLKGADKGHVHQGHGHHDHDHHHHHDHHDHKHEHHEHKGHEHQGHHHEHHHHDHDHDHKHNHKHNHDHKEGHHHHHHDHQDHHDHKHHDHRNLAHIEALIDKSALSDTVKALSKKIFMEVAVAEAKVHGKDLQEVHFHEVGAVDSIVDIVGAAICFEALGVDQVMASSVELGGGFVKCDHGMMPVPAPATAEILKGVPVKRGLVDKEMTTPTGAAILKALVSSYSDQLQMNVSKIGYGLGTRDLEFPNVLRVMLLTEADPLKDVLKKNK